ncbi:ABC transporter permease [Peribacillus huizhouensis]|uniref:Putative hemin transport system permease protein HrtB n=1 Tax=Peribacillus huizhouensis TaxID=1501239 RepID=A0ABR6CMD0_9BACI|nr:ABC transporter permease [Peribacillus huizhouensis]MBA9026165.1 putative ABC transport system permease protein [Peribacillus huizhouensis]
MFLALREMKHAKLRYVLIGFIMVLLIWLVLFVSGLANGLSSDNASSIQNMNTNYLVLQQDSDNRLTRSTISDNNLQDVRQYTEEGKATPLGVQMTTITKSGATKKLDITFFAIDVNSMLAPTISEGKMINQRTAHEIVADRSIQLEGFKLGDEIEDLASGETFKIVGFTEGQSFSHTPVVYMNFNGWSTISHQQTPNQEIFNTIALNISANQAKQIEKNLPNVDVISKDQALQGIPGYKEEQGSLIMMIAFLFVISAFVLAVFFYVMTIQKMNQFGVLKAIGAKSTYLARTIIFQVLFITIVSLLISISLTIGVSFILPDSMPFNLSTSLVFGCSILFLVVSMIGALLSLYRVSKIDAIEAIGRAV